MIIGELKWRYWSSNDVHDDDDYECDGDDIDDNDWW